MTLYQLHTKQFFPVSKDILWDFISDPANLKEITPNYMGFDILAGADSKMYQGQIIAYKVKPLPGFSTKWITEITHVNDHNFFVDEQRFGPYQLWHHKHFVEEKDGGTLMTDIVDYKLPAGILGTLVHPILVKPKLQEIFAYRATALTNMFGNSTEHPYAIEFKTI